MDEKALFRLSYGLYVLTAKIGEKDNGCIIDTALQVTAVPNRLGVCVNKNGYTHDMIMETGKLTISVIHEQANLELISRFGFQSGRNVNKFDDFADCKRGENGIYYITAGTNAYISAQIEKSIDLGTHTMFVGDVTDMQVLNDLPSATYDYYQNIMKPQLARMFS